MKTKKAISVPTTGKAAKKAVVKITPVKKVAAKAEAPAAPPVRQTKKAAALAMLKEGATAAQLMESFGWLRHTTRGFLSILGKTHKLESFKDAEGQHTYKLAD